jgi:hypothetical protein
MDAPAFFFTGYVDLEPARSTIQQYHPRRGRRGSHIMKNPPPKTGAQLRKE